MKKIIMTIVSVIMTANMIVSGNVMTAKAKAEETKIRTCFDMSEVVSAMKQVGQNKFSDAVYLDLMDGTKIYFETKMDLDETHMGQYAYTTCWMKNNQFVGIHGTYYY